MQRQHTKTKKNNNKKALLTSLGGSFTSNLKSYKLIRVRNKIFYREESQTYLGEGVLCQAGVKDGIRDLVPKQY